MENITTLKELNEKLDLGSDLYSEILNYINLNFSSNENSKIFNITANELDFLKRNIYLRNNVFEFINDEFYETDNQNKLKNINKEIEKLDNEIYTNNYLVSIYDMLCSWYKEIKNWDDVFNIWDISDVKLADILENIDDNFKNIISNVIWDKDYENDLTFEEKEYLNTLFNFIKEYSQSNKVYYSMSVKEFLKNYWISFNNFLLNIFKEKSNSID